jgi:hypothetical protein
MKGSMWMEDDDTEDDENDRPHSIALFLVIHGNAKDIHSQELMKLMI